MKQACCNAWFVVGMSLAAGSAWAQADASPTRAQGMVMLDYEVIPVPGDKSIDLMGFHFFNRMNDWLYLGVGGYAPLFKGEYGGFLALDVSAHVQRKLFGNVFADAGVSLGGGGGGKSVVQSRVLSGTGGFVKTYIGLGYDLGDYAVGVNLARMKFMKSAINHSQLNAYVQVPFSYSIGPYARSGERLGAADAASGSENMLTLGLDNFVQIRPKALNRDTINVAELQYSHFFTRHSYWYVNAGVGYRGLPLYNQVLGGLGQRFPLTSRLNLYGQVAVGSGGYAPETIDTGPGLLVHPKLSAEYMLNRNFGLALSAGYLFAPRASSKNYSVGAALNYHIYSGERPPGATGDDGPVFRGYRVNVFPQTELNVRSRGVDHGNINMVSVQLDNLVNAHVYVPIQVSIAYNAYLNNPGYGELLAGVGLQTRHDKSSRLQWFGQLLLGTNSHGPMLKTGVGLNLGVGEQTAVYGLVGQTFGLDDEKFRADYIGIGLTHRFSLPGW